MIPFRGRLRTALIILAILMTGPQVRPDGKGFTDVLEGSGIGFRHQFLPSETGKTYRINQYDHGSGVLVADYDGDGSDDIYFLNFLGDNGLYRNKGDGTFENTTARAGVGLGQKICVGGAFSDIDNDGDPDLYVTTYRSGNQLLRNNGDGTFTDITALTGTGYIGHSNGAVFFDYDVDGDLDLYVSNIGRFTTDIFNQELGYFVGFALPDEVFQGNVGESGERNVLYRNEGPKRWPDVAPEVGLDTPGWNGDAAVSDYDLDGDLDLYTANMFGENTLYRNDKGRFTAVTRETLGRTSYGAIGALFFDADDNGYPDLFVVDMHSDMWLEPRRLWLPPPDYTATREEILDHMGQYKKHFLSQGHARAKYNTPIGPTAPAPKVVSGKLEETSVPFRIFGNSFFLNRGGGRFEEASDRAGLETWWPWGIAAGDLDNDGDQDLFVASGMGYPYFYWPNQLLINQGDGTFTERASELGVEPPARGEMIAGAEIWNVPFARSSRAVAFLDLENDGDLDIVTNNFNHEPYLLRNDLPRRNWIELRLEGAKVNRDAIGTRVTLRAGGRELHRQVTGTGGYATQSRRALHFGLGDADRAEEVTVTWPDGSVQKLKDLPAGRMHKIRQQAPASPRPAGTAG